MSLPELDDLDRRILNALQIDASHTNAELAERVHVSPPTCLRRVKALEASGIIEGYRAENGAVDTVSRCWHENHHIVQSAA